MTHPPARRNRPRRSRGSSPGRPEQCAEPRRADRERDREHHRLVVLAGDRRQPRRDMDVGRAQHPGRVELAEQSIRAAHAPDVERVELGGAGCNAHAPRPPGRARRSGPRRAPRSAATRTRRTACGRPSACRARPSHGGTGTARRRYCGRGHSPAASSADIGEARPCTAAPAARSAGGHLIDERLRAVVPQRQRLLGTGEPVCLVVDHREPRRAG